MIAARRSSDRTNVIRPSYRPAAFDSKALRPRITRSRGLFERKKGITLKMETRIVREGYLWREAVFVDVEVDGRKHNVGTSDGFKWSIMHIHGPSSAEAEGAARQEAEEWAKRKPAEFLRLRGQLQKETIKTEQQAEAVLQTAYGNLYSGTAERDGDAFVVALYPYAAAPVAKVGDFLEGRSTVSFGEAIDDLARRVPPQDPHFWETLAQFPHPELR